MGVSQSRSVLDLLPASGSAGVKRNQNSTNQAMFDVALKSASAVVPQASGNEKISKQDVASSKAEDNGKSVPQNGKEIPEKDAWSATDKTSQSKVASEQASDVNENKTSGSGTSSDEKDSSERNTLADDKHSSADDDSEAKDSSDRSTAADENGVADEDAVADKDAAIASRQKDDAEVEAEAAEQDTADDLTLKLLSEGEVDSEAAGDSVDAAISELSGNLSEEASFDELIQDIQKGDVDAATLLSKLEKTLDAEGVSLDDIRGFLEENEILSSSEFEQLLNDPEELIAQLQQLLQSNTEFSAYLKEMGGADIIARLAATFDSRTNQTSAPRFADVLKAEGTAVQEAGRLVSQLLQEQGAGKDAESGFDKDKLFEQLLTQKGSENSGKVSGFAGIVLKDGMGSSAGQALSLAAAGAGAVSGAESLQGLAQRAGVSGAAQNLPQLPVLRGLPGQPGATEALNERIMMMRSKGIQTAEIRLDPPDLGSLEVRVRVSGDTTTIQFHSPNSGVREALEAQVSRLREMMEGAGINLGQVDVSDQSLSERPDDSFASSDAASGGNSGSVDGDDETREDALLSSKQQSALGLVDYFA
ncbi:flagellar hook-length control protein FliK [Oceanospirillum sp.]|uniref:flagellar hook-length control protein FliK n=1 Tax=Oceanospirillum sp. TaxID=2021254 RepID=UPI003A8F6741